MSRTVSTLAVLNVVYPPQKPVPMTNSRSPDPAWNSTRPVRIPSSSEPVILINNVPIGMVVGHLRRTAPSIRNRAPAPRPPATNSAIVIITASRPHRSRPTGGQIVAGRSWRPRDTCGGSVQPADHCYRGISDRDVQLAVMHEQIELDCQCAVGREPATESGSAEQAQLASPPYVRPVPGEALQQHSENECARQV